MMQLISQIEVAFFMSTRIDATGAGERREKGKMPKEEMTWKSNLGHTVNNCMTVIRIFGWGAIGKISKGICSPAHNDAGDFYIKVSNGGKKNGDFYRSRCGDRHAHA